MSRLSHLLLDMAAWIAPPHRRPWIAGMRAEADHSTAWAWGALTTALGQRLADMIDSGLALRLAAGGFVIAVAVSFALFLIVRVPDIEAASVRAHRDLLPVTLALPAFVLLPLSGGFAILLSHGTSWLNRYGRVLFALGGLSIGMSLAGAGFATVQAALSTFAGPLFIGAAAALLFRRPRLFLALASGALAVEVAQYGLELPRIHSVPMLGIAFLNVCMPGLTMLAAFGLLIERRAPVAT